MNKRQIYDTTDTFAAEYSWLEELSNSLLFGGVRVESTIPAPRISHLDATNRICWWSVGSPFKNQHCQRLS